MAIADEQEGGADGRGAHAEMMVVFEEFKADTKKDLMRHVEAVIDRRITRLFSLAAERMDKMDARTTRVESSVEALTQAPVMPRSARARHQGAGPARVGGMAR